MPLSDEQWLEYLLRHGTNEVLHVAAAQSESIQNQGKWVLRDPANKLRKLAEDAAIARGLPATQPAQQDELRHLWDGSPMPNYRVSPGDNNVRANRPTRGPQEGR